MRQENKGVQQNQEKEMATSLSQMPELDVSPEYTEDINENITVGMCYIVQLKAYKEASNDATKEDFSFKSLGALVVKTSKTFEPEALVCLMGCCWIYQRSPNVILQGSCLEGWQYLKLVIASNWNNPNYTCIYEVGVYN
ncbi:uncharacterized protein LOC103282522 [Anolis carolinensis]|uniref:uncharacterized protein LOC103282522 n=1 Tax=Anolis carolinensis TaxID=28377 RepID=UPI002F2B8A2D